MNPELPPKISQKISFWEMLKEVAIFVGMIYVVFFVIRPYITEPYLVDGRSMDPTFTTGDYLIVDKVSYELGSPKRNDVVVFKYPKDPRKSFVKRIIGLPGETVIVKDSEVTIINSENPNGFKLNQYYVKHESTGSVQKTLAGDEYFVMGDNRTESFDSRAWGPVNKKYLSGKPVVRLWPINKMKFFPGRVSEQNN